MENKLVKIVIYIVVAYLSMSFLAFLFSSDFLPQTVKSVLALVGGLCAYLYAEKMSFDRRNGAGVELYSSYSESLAVGLIAVVLKLVGALGFIYGVLTLVLSRF